MSDIGHKIENPLFLFSLFEKGVYCIDADVELLNGLNNKTLGSVLQGDETGPNSQQIAQNSLQEIPDNAISTPPIQAVLTSHESSELLKKEISSERVSEENQAKPPSGLSVMKQQVKILNLFFDPADNPMQASALDAYPKLMQAIKLNGENLQSTDFAMIGLHQSSIMKSLITENGVGILPEIWKEFNTNFVIVWTNRRLTNPNIEHFQIVDFQGVSLILLPSFTTMLGNVELKKRVWINIKNLLGFV